MVDEEAIEMFVGGLVLDPSTQAPVIVLKDESGQISLPIWIGIAEATSIASAIKQLNMARPLTHDLMHEIFIQLGVNVERVVITELKDSTYYAELILSVGDKAIILDSRPSDAIAIALRASAPIFVAKQVLDHAQVAFNEAADAEGDNVPREVEPPEGDEPEDKSKDFQTIDKDKWDELLEKLDPDDFKYKM
ncbi:MAG: bifunctional nuclease family protein [Candidatus Dadabacteria bacterium]|nr:MAG: bifunctional nuclease family protein [Candidatus Dadabacteria bacterium]